MNISHSFNQSCLQSLFLSPKTTSVWYHEAWSHTRDLGRERLSSLFHSLEVAFSLTSSQNYRQEVESRFCARGRVCFVAKGVLWRQQVGLWIPSPTRRHEAHAQEASPAKYSWPPFSLPPSLPSPPFSSPPPSTGQHTMSGTENRQWKQPPFPPLS